MLLFKSATTRTSPKQLPIIIKMILIHTIATTNVEENADITDRHAVIMPDSAEISTLFVPFTFLHHPKSSSSRMPMD
jgi:hypothetical protein